MKTQFQELKLQQVDAALSSWRRAALPARPLSGWCRAIREALGMTASALAARARMTPSGLHKLEKAEAQEAITLASLRKLADALDCELQYALVPRTPLADRLQQRALEVARERLRPVAHSMSLEDQAVGEEASRLQQERLAKELLDGSRRDLW